MPTVTEIKSAIAIEIGNYLRQSGKWIATTTDGDEFGFRMNDTGHIGVYITNNETGDVDEYCFRLEIIED